MELLRDRRAAFDEAGVQPVGISRDSPWCHIAWRQALDLNFGLLSDFNGEAVRGFGIEFEFRGFREVARRSAFLVADDGIVRNAWYYETGDVPDVEEWIAAARGLRPGPLNPSA
jgi:peroxiredoxin